VCFIYNCIFWKWEHVPKKIALEPENLELTQIAPNTPEKAKNLELTDIAPNTPEKAIAESDNVYIHVPSSVPSSPTKREFASSPSITDFEEYKKQKELSNSVSAKIESTPSPFDTTTIPTTKGSVLALPWAVLPFLFGMFTLVQGLGNGGWIDVFSSGIISAIPDEENTTAIFVATFLMATISFVLCNLINNQPASIILAYVIINPLFASLPPKVMSAGMFGVIEGANVGANWTIIGALCGILWSTILRNKGIVIEYLAFAKNGLIVMPWVTASVAFIIFLEHL